MSKNSTPPPGSLAAAALDDTIAAGVARDAAKTITDAFAGTVADTPTRTVSVSPVSAPTPAGLSFRELAVGADAVHGHDLEQDKSALIGVPHLITGVVYRDGMLRNKQPTNYLSVEATIADWDTLYNRFQRGRITEDQLRRFSPNEAVVYNDGSAGIARQITAYLHDRELIQVPDGPEVGEVGECRWDVYRAQWIKGFDVDNPSPRFDIRLLCLRGLRVSEYEYGTGEAATFYLA